MGRLMTFTNILWVLLCFKDSIKTIGNTAPLTGKTRHFAQLGIMSTQPDLIRTNIILCNPHVALSIRPSRNPSLSPSLISSEFADGEEAEAEGEGEKTSPVPERNFVRRHSWMRTSLRRSPG